MNGTLPSWIFLFPPSSVAQLAHSAAKGSDLNLYLSSGLIIMTVRRQIETWERVSALWCSSEAGNMREFREISVKSLAGCYSKKKKKKKGWSVPCVLMAAGVVPDELRPPCRMLKHWVCHRSKTELINFHVFTKVVSACVLNNNNKREKKNCSFLLRVVLDDC